MDGQGSEKERNLVRLAQGGDEEAFARLVETNQAAVYRIALRMTGNRQEAEEVAQEAFVRAYMGLARFDLRRPLAPWLYRIVHNSALTRISRTPPHVPLEDWVEDDSSPGPEAQALTGELRDRLRRSVASLPEHYRRAIELRHFEGLSYRQMAAVLEVPLSDVKSWLFRARQILQRELE